MGSTLVMFSLAALCMQMIMLLACSCFGLQQLVDIREQYGKQWDIIFNPRKTQCVTFGGKNPDKCCIILNGNKLEWIEKNNLSGLPVFLTIGDIHILRHHRGGRGGCLTDDD